ncbi:PDDEXK family nuclease [Leptospira kanakyensis]|uniref:endonuclease NucS domain-containing protein n=1 Tax=Leptospira kanakyensis TaxID=2484968 RepID=UPI00223DE011|nr:endonuclease NucS domain-containing protein [Leptospira kanakyensis]MCW7471710.1 endonuclease NucS [Leptospira kanakyensis]
MATKINIWQINKDQQLTSIDSKLSLTGRTEAKDLEEWVSKFPNIVSPELSIIGRQVKVASGGEIDLLAIDQDGNLVIIELKRDELPREALSQAIEYASCISEWTYEDIDNQCHKYLSQSFEDFFSITYPGVNLEDLTLNSAQRIFLVGFDIGDTLERMISWLFSNYAVSINAVTLHYAKTSSGEEIIARTVMIAEEIEKSTTNKRKFKLAMSDEAGNYTDIELEQKLTTYLSQNTKTATLIKDLFLPLLLNNETVNRQMIKDQIVLKGYSDEKYSFTLVSNLSTQMGLKKNDFLRQIISYSNPNYAWEKENYKIQKDYSKLVEKVLQNLGHVA